ncbi:efflux RND transporter permease subunit [Sutcliffiella deserti]|uniref:efflux RND transporter permease subunit n=1 Tax=Sutcliffiella deserti TaxID=2875501 RepID=UPI001CBAFFE7|nr:efflux RND transporter permease subunit [Sutcliffiella deserti]
MSLLEFILRRKIAVGLLVVFVFIIGFYSLNKLDQELMPPISFDMTVVQVDAGEMSVLDVENNVTEQIEQTLNGIDGVESHSSATYIGRSSITVFIEEGRGEEVHKNIEAAVLPLQAQLPGVQNIGTFQMSTNQPFEFFMEISNGKMEDITSFAQNIVKPRLEALPEVREVQFDGLEENEIMVQLKSDQLEKFAVDSQAIMQTIQQSNLLTSLGELSEEANEPTLRWNTSLETVEDVRNILIPTNDGVKALSELADIRLQVRDISSGVWKDGSQEVVLVQIGRVADVTQIEMAAAVRAEVQNIREEALVKDFQFEEIVAQADYVSESVDGVTSNILIGGLLAIIVLFLFLRNIRATIIIGISIPLSILLTFACMWFLGYSINMLSLIALGLGIGMMVDASIVILESIYRKKEQGRSNTDAVLQGVKEVASAVIASMLTTIVVFLPIGLLGGEAGKFMIILSVVVIVTLVSSVLVSFTLIPSLSENFLKLTERQKVKRESRIIRSYGNFIQWLTNKKRRRYGVIFLFFIMFSGSLALVTKVPMTIMPDVYNRYAEIMVTLESGVTPEEKNEIAEEVNRKLEQIPDVRDAFVLDQIEFMFILINMTSEEEATLEQKEVNERIMSALRDLEETHPVEGVTSAMGMGASYPVQLEISGDSLEELGNLSENLISELNRVDGIVGTTTSMEKMLEEQLIVLNEEEMQKDGITPLQLYGQLNTLTASTPVGSLKDEDGTLLFLSSDITMSSKNDFLNVSIQTPQGEEMISKYIELETVEAPTQIDRKEGQRVLKVLANIEDRDLGSVNRDVQSLLDSFTTPDGYTVSVSGSLEEQQEAITDMILILTIAIFLVYVVMAVQFNHLLHPIIVMTIIPLTFTGVILGLLLTQRELSIMSGMGVIMLIGIVLNNAILLIDRAKQLKLENHTAKQAIVEAGMNRMRPIFMTTLTTIGGMLPLAISTGAASNYQAPLATVVISGLLFSTLITLVLIPAVYMLFHDIGNGVRKVFKKKEKENKAEKVA